MKQRPIRILFAGGGTGGHFYPIIAVAEAVLELAQKEHIALLELYFMSDDAFDKDLLAKTHLSFIEIVAGKRRAYFSINNFFDIFKTLYGCLLALIRLLVIYPDVVFGKGGYGSFPAMFAARILRIPVVIHESDIIPGRVNRWIGSYATNIAISYPEAIKYFTHTDRVALTGQPIRKVLLEIPNEDPYQVLGLEPSIPTILVIGGSQGSEKINDDLTDILPRILLDAQVIHQTGEKNYAWIKKRADGLLAGVSERGRYHPFPFLESQELRLAAKAATLIISRAGSSIFEIAIWAKPAILIPLPTAREDHQRENAYSYARTGGAVVIEEKNLKPELFLSVINAVLSDPVKQQAMIAGSKAFAKTDAGDKIAHVLLAIATKHGE